METTVAEQAGDKRDRTFWAVFAVAWLAYLGLVTGEAARHEDVMLAVGFGLLNAGPPAALSFVVALNRRRLLRAEWSLVQTLGVHSLTGLLYALGSASIVMGISAIAGLSGSELGDMGRGGEFVFRTMNGIFLYLIFAGVLMWSESIRRVHESHSMVAREAALRAEAEAKAIRAQFNPHFVFNTLHSLMLLVRADPATAERAIEDVATLIRYASILQRKDVDAVPLSKELEVARRYVALEKLRLEDRLCVTWAVDVEPGQLTVPAFALQTLIENAIRHGLEPKPEGGRVEVRIRVDEGTLSVTVEDDGNGSDPAAVGQSSGHGLELLRRRLDARYGDAGSLEWTTAPGEGFSVTVRLPAESPAPQPALDMVRGGADDS